MTAINENGRESVAVGYRTGDVPREMFLLQSFFPFHASPILNRRKLYRSGLHPGAWRESGGNCVCLALTNDAARLDNPSGKRFWIQALTRRKDFRHYLPRFQSFSLAWRFIFDRFANIFISSAEKEKRFERIGNILIVQRYDKGNGLVDDNWMDVIPRARLDMKEGKKRRNFNNSKSRHTIPQLQRLKGGK